MAFLACMYFIQYIQADKAARRLCHRLTFLSVHSSRVLGTLALFARRQKNNYISNQQVSLNRLYFETSKKYLTIDTRDANEFGPGKFRTPADNGEEQTCYFNRNKSDKHFTSFVAKRIRNSSQTIIFSIFKVNSDLCLVNKSLNIELNNSLDLYGRSKRQLQQTGKGNLNNGRSETSIKSGTDIGLQRQCRKHAADNTSKLNRIAQKKPR